MSDERTLAEILDAAKDGSPTTHEECLYALLVMQAMSVFDGADFRRVVELANGKRSPFNADFYAEESFKRTKRALSVPPRKFLGTNNDPANPEVRERVLAARRLYEKVAGSKS